MMRLPFFWMNETSGVLRPAVETFLANKDMTPDQIAAMRAYLRQWIVGPWAPCEALDMLRKSVNELHSASDIARWIEAAIDMGADPL